MYRELLHYLECIACGGGFQLKTKVCCDTDPEEILEGSLQCSRCGEDYRIMRGVPRILPGNISSEKQKTAKNFGAQWRRFRRPGAHYEQLLIDELKPLDRDCFRDKFIADLGCGMGRNPLYFAQQGAKMVVGVDLSDAVDEAYEYCRMAKNIHIIQADIHHLPLKPVFDLCLSQGVLHHLPNPAEGFRKVVALGKPGANVFVWVYGRENNEWIVKVVNPLRYFTSRLPLHLLRLFSWPLTLFLMLLLRLIYRPVNAFSRRLGNLLFYNDYLYNVSPFSFEELELIVFDHLTAPTAFYISRQQFDQWFRDCGLSPYRLIWHNRNSWKGIGTIPN